VYAGAYRLAVELDVPDRWQTVRLVTGVTWKKMIHSSRSNWGHQTVNVLEIDLAAPGVEVKPRWQGGCIRTSGAEADPKALSALNGGFFASGCRSRCLVKVDGALRATNQLGSGPRRSFGLTPQEKVLFEAVDHGADWPGARQALGGHPNLVTNGAVDIWPPGTTGFYTSRHPRTAIGVTASGKLLWVTVDGRTSAGEGMTIGELARLMVDLGAAQAINLDGGGSTTLWIRDMSINGIVNYPPDNRKADHYGERSVSDSLVLYAGP
jgi:hypothetical protein